MTAVLPEDTVGVVRFAALGDSVTVGLGDRRPGGGWRGWVAILGESLAPPARLELANLARCGALVRDVAAEQLPRALAGRPTLASVLVGVNDTLRGDFDLGRIAVQLEEIIARLRGQDTVVLTASLPDPGLMLRVPRLVCRPLARRIEALNVILGHLSRRYGTVHVDLAREPALYERRMWGADRLHPSERGHRLLASICASALAEHGVAVWTLPDSEPANPPPGIWSELAWLSTKGTAWILRRSRDLLPRLAWLILTEGWHKARRRTAHLDTRLRAEIDEVLRQMGIECRTRPSGPVGGFSDLR
jgi:lysophospholipase L1-like esterase